MDRATVFGEVADIYDRIRPRYPAEMFDDLMATAALRTRDAVLEIGAGTGIATEALLDRGLAVTVVEPDPRMLEVARRRLVGRSFRAFEGRFEDVEGGRYGLVFAAGSWHWVDPGIGPSKAAEVLDPTGSLALAWNLARPEDLPRPSGLDEAYREHAPELVEASQVRNRTQDHRRDTVVASGCFAAADEFRYPFTRSLATAEYCDLLATHSDHRMVGPDRLRRLLSAVGAVIDAHGGTIELKYETLMYVFPRV